MIFKGKIWITSDTHYNHSNICSATTIWKKDEIADDHLGVRKFDNLGHMNSEITNQINNNVGVDDTLFHLGDWSFGGIDSTFEFRRRINCKNVHLILGNHDHHIRNNRFVPDEQQKDAKLYLNVLHEVQLQELFSSVNEVLQVKVQLHRAQKAISIFLSHYSHRVWDKHHKGYYHAFAHSHGSLDYAVNGRSIDVGIDTAKRRFGEYRPYEITEFIKICNKSDIQSIDHHT